MPISIRKADDPVGGNRITLIRFPVPVADRDPVRASGEMGDRCRSAREERSLPYTNAIAAGLNVLPPGVVGSMLKHVDFVASNVPGFPSRVYLAGAPVERYVAFGPTIGTSVNITLMSYAGTCSVGMNIDIAAVPDPRGVRRLHAGGVRGGAPPGRRARAGPAAAPRCRGAGRARRRGAPSSPAAVSSGPRSPRATSSRRGG